ncbi:uncharacterized protein LOC131692216 [Topomyia yanbarensis]|uniref:uncharacterized protein LOC131692216 n=1 Tax=Topomyia yanbarensis TaxID=2498891 RepID=UPI00273CBE79|nr:uncharacterized protein LOC131692216 [Topomyia yanbarensis]
MLRWSHSLHLKTHRMPHQGRAMRKCCLLLLLLPIVYGFRPPAAVFEDVYEQGRPSPASYLTTQGIQDGMQAYLNRRNRQLGDGFTSIAASQYSPYTASSERYQNFEENQHDRIRLENLQKIPSIRRRRLDLVATPRQSKKVNVVPREMLRFTLADAIIRHDHDPEQAEDSSKVKQRTKRQSKERSSKRIEPVPRDILRFELKDAMTEKPTLQAEDMPHNVRRRRSADPESKEGRKMVSFELEDAKTPDRDTKLFHKQMMEENPNLRMPFTTSDTFTKGSVHDEIVERPEVRRREGKKDKRDNPMDESDMNIEESRRVKVSRGNKKKMANYEDLPLGVQKAIDIAIQENERMNGKTTEEPSRGTKYYYGDKKPKIKKPYSTTTNTKSNPPSTKESKVISSPQMESGFVPTKPIASESGENLKPEKTSPGTWWSASNIQRPKRLQQKTVYPPLVVSPQYVQTYKPTMESHKMTELSPGYENPRENSYEYSGASKEEKPKIQYLIKEVPVPLRPRTKITVQPTISISYDKEPTAPATSSEDQSNYNNPYGPVELRYEQPKEQANSYQNLNIVVPDSKEQSEPSYYDHNNVDNPKSQESSSHASENYDKTGSSIAALSALIGKRPTAQLRGLNNLLHMPIPIGNQQPLQTMKTRIRPQDSTAPIMFPGEASTPNPLPKKTPGYRSVKIENGPKIVYEDPNASALYHTVQMNPQLKVPMTKDYTPIKELVTDITDSDLVGPTVSTPTHATYIIGSTPATPQIEANSYELDTNSHESSHYQEYHEVQATPEPISVQYQTRQLDHRYHEQHQHQHQRHQEVYNEHSIPDHYHHHDDEDSEDSEGYAFGYRVRDFHTGNDFGHVQNRDNGVTRGEYHILLPDGRVQNVRYTADEQGFHAEVSYESVHSSHEATK